MKRVSSLLLMTAMLVGCGPEKVDQSSICVYRTDEEAKQCKNGQLSYFRPSSWGSEQLPLNVAATYCDLNHEVIYNSAGVVCVFTTERADL